MKLGTTIKSLRSKMSMSQVQLAEKSNITQAYLSLIENGSKQPNMEVLNSISNALGTSTPFLIFYSISEEDVPDEKKEIYEILHPHMKQMVDKLISNELESSV